MLFEEVENRAVVILEDLNDLEVAFDQIAHLSWDVLVAIATGRCEGAAPKDFARVAVETELAVRGPHNLYDYHRGVWELLEAQKSAPAKGASPPTNTKPAPKKPAPKPKTLAKAKQPRGKPKKRG